MSKRPTKAQLAKKKLVEETIQATLAAGTKTLQDEFYFSDKQGGIWILKTSILLYDHLGIVTDDLQKALDELAEKHERTKRT